MWTELIKSALTTLRTSPTEAPCLDKSETPEANPLPALGPVAIGSETTPTKATSEMVRFDFACKKCEGTFTLWSDAAKCCPSCGSKRVFKIFLTAPAFSTGRGAAIEKLAEQQLDAAGLSNFTNRGGIPKRTRRADRAQALAVAQAKRLNMPYNPNAPITTGPAAAGLEQKVEVLRKQYRDLGAQGVIKSFGGEGKTRITNDPRGPGAVVNQVVQRARQIAPLSRMGERIYHKEAKGEVERVQSLMGKR